MGQRCFLKRKCHLTFGVIILCASLVPLHKANADAAPPQAPPGSSVETGGFETNVQMVAEEVVIDVGYYTGERTVLILQDLTTQDQTPEEILAQPEYILPHYVLEPGDLSAHIDATFVMKNQGNEEEAFDVWFPIGADDGYAVVAGVANFRAWVNEVPAEVGQSQTRRVDEDYEEYRRGFSWATWPAAFPAGEEVILRVSYDIPPTNDGPWREFEYVLETGAGWWGTIGEGTIIMRLPYETITQNVTLSSTWPEKLEIDRSDLLISGGEIRWQFTDLEPPEGANLQLAVLDPVVWTEIQAARSAAAANPDSVEAQIRFAHALEDALLFKHSLIRGWGFAQEAKATYEHALELDPENIDLYVDYLELLFALNLPIEPPPEEFLPTLEHALELAPEDTRLLQLQEQYHTWEEMFATPTPRPSPTARPSPSPTPKSTQTSIPAPSPSPVPSGSAASSPNGPLIIALTAVIVSLGGIAWWYARRSRK
jgi:tetratricopeptide (TPR) repeat protein